MQAQPSLFNVGRAGLPARVLAFASGANAAREIRGFGLARVPVGFSAELIGEDGVQEILQSSLPVFADSGAFSEVTMTGEGPRVTHPIGDRSWLERLALYLRLARTLGKQLYVVAPDRVADQKETLRLIERYRSELQEIARTGARVLVPIQRGELSPESFYAAALVAAGMALVPALPMKKAAVFHTDVLSFVDAIRPERLHLLGMGYERRAARSLVRNLLCLFPDLSISLDSNRLRAVTGRERSLTLAENALRDSPIGSLHGEVEHEALDAAGERLDYTDLIASPSSWADAKTVASIAATVFDTASERESFQTDPDGYLQQQRGDDRVWECPLVTAALEEAWQQWAEGKIRMSVRTAAIRGVFTDCRIAMPRKELHEHQNHEGAATRHP